MTTSKTQDERPVHQLPKRFKRYAEILATGTKTKSQACREAGFKESIARARCHAWIGDTRLASEYPFLWDYYENLRRKNLRDFDLSVEVIRDELKLIAMADVTRFIDLPKAEYDKAKAKALKIDDAIRRMYSFDDMIKLYNDQQHRLQTGGKLKKGEQLIKSRPEPPDEEAIAMATWFEELPEEQQREVMVWRSYQAGSIRLKNAEDIPASLTPAIAELSQTRDGIKLKLHDKGAALDRLAKILGMYAPEKENEAGQVVTSITFEVKGASSPLLALLQETIGQAAVVNPVQPPVAP